ncbi:MAG: hypothetical protein ACOC5T_04405 [Elusimicrobiota bacterium]
MANVTTVWGSVTLEIPTETSEQVYTVILLDKIYNITHNNDWLLWDSSGLSSICFSTGDEGESIEIKLYETTYIIQWDGIIDNKHKLIITVNKDNTCAGIHLDSTLSTTLYDKVQNHNIDPSGKWEDFNKLHKRWELYREWRYICPDYIPDEVRVEDYPN